MEKQKRRINKIAILLAAQCLTILFLAWQLGGKGQEYVLQMEPVSRGEESGGVIDYFSQYMELEKGTYRVMVDYAASSDMTNVIDVLLEDVGAGVLKTNTTPLYAGQLQTSYIFWLGDFVSGLQVKVTSSGEGVLTVSGGKLVRTNHAERQRLLSVALAFVLLDSLLYAAFRWNRMEEERKRESRKTAFLLGSIILGASLPLFEDYLLPGADMTFHLLRIEGIREGLISGQFPVRIESNWLQGHGYAAGIFYCNLFLYLPAFLRMMGFTVQAAYKCYKLAVNTATCLIAWHSFKKMSGSNNVGIFGSFLYTFYLVRLIYLYEVDGVGQYTAMAFLPLVAYGFYRILTKDCKTPEERFGFLPLVIGLSGVLCSHVLSCEILAFFVLMLCVVCPKKVFRKEVFLQLCKAVAITVLLNLWYLAPFADYMFSMDFAVTKGGAAYKQIQTWGMYIPQLFEPFQRGGRYGAYPAENGMVAEISYSIGMGLSLGLLLIVFLLTVVRRPLEKEKQGDGKQESITGKAGKISLGFGLLSMWMATIYFPWDRLAKCSGILRQLIATLQFPNRMLTFTGVFLTMACCFAIQDLRAMKDAGILRPVIVRSAVLAICIGHLLTAVYFCNTAFADSSEFFRLYDETAMGNGYISGGEYVLLGTDTKKLTYKGPVCSEGIALNSYEKEGCHIRIDCDCGKEGQYIELPLLYYKGYKAIESGGQALRVVCGENNVVRVLIPSGFQGIVEVDFIGFWYWRAAELLSLGGWCLLGISTARKFYSREQNAKQAWH